MIKKVKVELLEPGVYVQDFNSDWRTNNLFINQTLIRDKKVISILQGWGIKEVYIDTDKGKDVIESIPAREALLETDLGLKKMAEQRPVSTRNIPLSEELAVAKNIKKQAVTVIQNVMDKVREGKPLETEETYQLIVQMEKSVTRNRDALILLTKIRKKDPRKT